MQQFTHYGNNDCQFIQASLGQTLGKGVQERIVGHGNDGWHIECGPDGGASHLGNLRPAPNRTPRLAVARGDPGRAIAAAYALYDEVLALAQEHVPQANLTGAREWFHYQRPQWRDVPHELRYTGGDP